MNDFERQLSHQPLRPPPPEWRAGILDGAAKIVAPSWTWRDWFWPSPIAWGALAAVWVGAFVLGNGDEPSSPSLAAGRGTNPPEFPLPILLPGSTFPGDTPLYVFSSQRTLSALLDNPR